jgi:hypothetical protein
VRVFLDGDRGDTGDTGNSRAGNGDRGTVAGDVLSRVVYVHV